MVQKALSAKSLTHAQGATILTGWIKVLPLFLIVIPGMISRVLYPNEVGCVNPETVRKCLIHFKNNQKRKKFTNSMITLLYFITYSAWKFVKIGQAARI